MEIYHGSGDIVEFPEVRIGKFTKDFSYIESAFLFEVREEWYIKWEKKIKITCYMFVVLLNI